VRALGIDLAWGERQRTGLCVIAGDRVLDSTHARTDDEIVAWSARWAAPADEVVAGIDAPLIVPNVTGRRPCEAVFCDAFRGCQAGVYPANRSLPAFRARIRGAELAARLGLSVDPAAGRARPVRVALEIYPHSAMVSLFALERTLKYKARHARDVRTAAFHEMLHGLQGLAAADPPLDVKTSPRWEALHAAVGAGQGHRVEDELDAYVCAYAAVYHDRWHGRRSLVVGDVARGYIVTPVDARAEGLLRAAGARHGVFVG
jgi:predicted RNase H-like nuclease